MIATRVLLLLFLCALPAGCASTTVIERHLDNTAIPEINGRCVDGCSAEVSYGGWSVPLSTYQNIDSLYSSIRGKDVGLRLDSKTVLQGRVSRFADRPDKWIMGRVSEHGRLVDTLHVQAQTVDSAWVCPADGIKANLLRASPDLLYLGSSLSIPFAAAEGIVITEDRRYRKKPFWIGFFAGSVPGVIGGGIIGAILCDATEDEDGHSGCNSRGSWIAFGSISAGVGAGLITGGLTAAIGTNRRTIYHFRRGSVSATPGGATLSVDLGR